MLIALFLFHARGQGLRPHVEGDKWLEVPRGFKDVMQVHGDVALSLGNKAAAVRLCGCAAGLCRGRGARRGREGCLNWKHSRRRCMLEGGLACTARVASAPRGGPWPSSFATS